ncbi:hypothetical protein CQW37_04037 [Bacteroides fragilis]|uniref:hypothetical protein n=1 Tax=Bacteroides fragilis TaxID=817 RepID=UPI000CB56838|nr:hypothetical protein CQW37_04037 [Bacteroides fragilis]
MYIDKLEHRDILSYYRKVKIEALKMARKKVVYMLEAIGKRPGGIIRIMEEWNAEEDMFAQGHILIGFSALVREKPHDKKGMFDAGPVRGYGSTNRF